MVRTYLYALVGASILVVSPGCDNSDTPPTNSGGTTSGGGQGGEAQGGNSAGGSGQGGNSAGGSGQGGSGQGGNSTGGSGQGGSGQGGGGGAPLCVEGEKIACYSGDPTKIGIGVCAAGAQTCSGGMFGPCEGEVLPGVEVCNGADDDCNGQTDELGTETCGLGICQVTVALCQNGMSVVCTPLPASPEETCEGTDDNCNGQVDEGCTCTNGTTQPCYSGPVGTDKVGVCLPGTQTCVRGAWAACVGDVTPSAELCDGLDNNCDGTTDEALGTISCGVGVCAATVQSCVGGVPQQCTPGPASIESCDGLDNDCNGFADDGLGNVSCGIGACSNTVVACANGQANTCTPLPAGVESCDGIDNNCNGSVDDGLGNTACGVGACVNIVPFCLNGQVNACVPKAASAEVCDGIDNNCNGTVDDGLGNASCGVGACSNTVPVCLNGQANTCVPKAASAEVCDGIDNNCNGTVDDGLGTLSCGVGACSNTVSACLNGQAQSCVPNPPSGEICDGIDNDCNGTVDEGLGVTSCGIGQCQKFVAACVNGQANSCTPLPPSVEICDGLDNDCDGIVDDGNPGGGGACNTGLSGVCAAGTLMCNNGALSCLQTVFPSANDICGNGKDDNCNGTVDENVDQDGDGWGLCDGDCCDSAGPCSQTPALVNPGAYEVLNNSVNDDCDAATTDTIAPPDCSPPPLQTPTTALKLTQAMDLCNFTIQSPPLPQKKWGVITNTLTSADGIAAAPQDIQLGVLNNYGTNVLPKKGGTMASLSSGTARDQGDVGWVQPNGGWQTGSSGSPPAAYLAAHGGVLQTAPGCPAGNTAFDSANLKLKIRVPTNAKSFSYKFKFYSAEYPEWLCNSYNDFFLALLTSQVAGIPADKNISFDSVNNPVSVNVGFFDVCADASCSAGTAELIGTGMGGNNGALTDGGGTVWLTTTSPVKPGEDLTIEFIIFDTGDHGWDSLVLLDDWKWDLNPAVVGTSAFQ